MYGDDYDCITCPQAGPNHGLSLGPLAARRDITRMRGVYHCISGLIQGPLHFTEDTALFLEDIPVILSFQESLGNEYESQGPATVNGLEALADIEADLPTPLLDVPGDAPCYFEAFTNHN